jgi:hypothetical protein
MKASHCRGHGAGHRPDRACAVSRAPYPRALLPCRLAYRAITDAGTRTAVIDIDIVRLSPVTDLSQANPIRNGPPATTLARSATRAAGLAACRQVRSQHCAELRRVPSAQVDFIGRPVQAEPDRSLRVTAIESACRARSGRYSLIAKTFTSILGIKAFAIKEASLF